MIPSREAFSGGREIMMGPQKVDQSQLFYLFNLEKRIPSGHLLRRITAGAFGFFDLIEGGRSQTGAA